MDAPNRFGKVSELRIATEFRDDKTVMTERFFTAPFKIMLPLYENKFEGREVMQMLQLMASPGIMAGDTQKFSFHSCPLCSHSSRDTKTAYSDIYISYSPISHISSSYFSLSKIP